MELLIEVAIEFLRSKLNLIIAREPASLEELHCLVQDLLDLQDEFQALVNFIEDINCFSLE